MIDTHAHIDTSAFDDDRTEMLQRAFDSGVERIVIPSIGIEGWNQLQELVETDERLYRGIGIHPHNVAATITLDILRAERECKKTRVVAIGEIGLDYYYDFAPKKIQQYWFREQLRLAKRVDKPVIIHNREADEDVLRIIEEEQDGTLRGVLHCFSSGEQVLHQALNLGMHVSFTGNITFKKSLLDDIVRAVPDGRFMIETDSPYITPVPHRGKRNEPANVHYIAQKIAELRNTTIESIIAMTTRTATSLFRLALFAISILIPLQAFAQRDNVESDSTDEPATELVHPYPKSLGISFIASTNTIVDAWTSLDPTVVIKPNVYAYEGILSFGGALHYAITDKIKFELGYIRSKNTKKVRYLEGVKQFDNGDSLPDVHQIIEGTIQYMVNPYSRVVFYGTGGVSYLMNTYNGGDGFINANNTEDRGRTRNLLGIVGGIGLFVNIKTPWGLLAPGGEWRLNFFSASEDSRFLVGNKYVPAKCDNILFYATLKYHVFPFALGWRQFFITHWYAAI